MNICSPKTIPWFVSDVNPSDVDSLLNALSSPSSFFSTSPNASQSSALSVLVERWKTYFESGEFSLSIDRSTGVGERSGADYWTGPGGYANLGLDDGRLLEELGGSGMVVFKGDLK